MFRTFQNIWIYFKKIIPVYNIYIYVMYILYIWMVCNLGADSKPNFSETKNTQEMDFGLGIWPLCVCCSSGLSYVLSHLSCLSCVTCQFHFQLPHPMEGCHGKDFCTTLRPWKICTWPSGPRKRPEESRETRFTSAVSVATSTWFACNDGWHCGGTVHFFTSNLALSIRCAMRHAPWRDSCLKWAHSRILQSLLTIALMSSGSFETFAVVCSNICPREVDIPAVQCEQPQLHTIAFHCQLRQNYDIQRHVT